jgi:hypothetical protein
MFSIQNIRFFDFLFVFMEKWDGLVGWGGTGEEMVVQTVDDSSRGPSSNWPRGRERI